MSKPDIALLSLNVLTIMGAVFGLTAMHVDPMGMALVVALVTALGNGAALVRRGRQPERAPLREAEELDARAVLDLDARLEAVERAQADAADAARWRALVESGQVSGPAAEAPEAHRAPLRGHTRNGAG